MNTTTVLEKLWISSQDQSIVWLLDIFDCTIKRILRSNGYVYGAEMWLCSMQTDQCYTLRKKDRKESDTTCLLHWMVSLMLAGSDSAILGFSDLLELDWFFLVKRNDRTWWAEPRQTERGMERFGSRFCAAAGVGMIRHCSYSGEPGGWQGAVVVVVVGVFLTEMDYGFLTVETRVHSHFPALFEKLDRCSISRLWNIGGIFWLRCRYSWESSGDHQNVSSCLSYQYRWSTEFDLVLCQQVRYRNLLAFFITKWLSSWALDRRIRFFSVDLLAQKCLPLCVGSWSRWVFKI